MVRKIFFLVILSMFGASSLANLSMQQEEKRMLGERIFHDVRLSKDGTQSCATCHNAARAFSDPGRETQEGIAVNEVSLGQDGIALGDRNAPMLTYVALTPEFHFDPKEELYIGGFFHDGRATTLEEQALRPFLDPAEMQMTEAELAKRLREFYAGDFSRFVGEGRLDDDRAILDAAAELIATFERGPEFASFDSKFDRVLRGDEVFSAQEQRGHDLFVAEDQANCAACHPVPQRDTDPQDSLFTDFTYDNLGVPVNHSIRRLNRKPDEYVDHGLAANPTVKNEELRGAFKVPSLRNIAVTAPYMHNGVFRDLKTVVAFYNTRDVRGALNPETGKPWDVAEIEGTKNTDELGDLRLTDADVEDIVAFMKTFTDQRFEHLLSSSQSH